MTREQLAAILWRYAGSPDAESGAAFADESAIASWAVSAVDWAQTNGYVNGVAEDQFGPNSGVTREQLVTILFRMSGSVQGGELMYTGIYEQAFVDSGKVSAWAAPAVWWSVYNDIWCGTNSPDAGTELHPELGATRAQIAVMMVRYMQMQEDVEI